MATDIKAVAKESEKDEQVRRIFVRDRDGKPYDGAYLDIVGEYSKAFRANERAVTERRIKDQRIGDDSPEAKERYVAEQAACGVVGWGGWESDGVPVPYSQENVVELFLSAPWIMKEAQLAIRGHARFFSAASTG